MIFAGPLKLTARLFLAERPQPKLKLDTQE